MARKKLTMDRVLEVADQTLSDMRILYAELRLFSLRKPDDELENLVKRFGELKNRWANLLTLGHGGAWRFFAESNGVRLPDEDEQNPDE